MIGCGVSELGGVGATTGTKTVSLVSVAQPDRTRALVRTQAARAAFKERKAVSSVAADRTPRL
jgi:hypothetical protein